MIPFAIAGLSSALSFFQSRKANKANSYAGAAALTAGRIQERQVMESAQLQKLKRINAERAIAGQLAVASAENGVGMGGTYAALERSNAYAAKLDTQIITTNARNANAAIETQAQAQSREYANRYVNPFLAAFSGGLSGLQSGLAIGGAIDDSGVFDPADKTKLIEG